MYKMLIVPLSALMLASGAASAQSGPSGGDVASPDRTRVYSESRGSGVTSAPPSIDSLMNRAVIGSDGAKIGKVTDVILGPDGQAQLIVIRSGGFLGIGGKDIAADLRLAETHTGSDAIKLRDVTTASVRDMPEFRYEDSMTSLNRSPRTEK
ncbi:PRC-barrel domain-containing protein [Azospirillum doebereinerae]|uniref:PRC-barrel domain containing protein n=1 Tax=Azospirillum doebereinerae TaxID=92933 RepID=A0A3S0X8C3_9PROT|nr:PRC-barrel domain-containing protein [Azospirillum doebereinerae]RUQ66056.1 PRC-barrel domain containing protein [Azospirillum doebereinerae]